MDFSRDTIEKIQELAEVRTIDINGRKYTTAQIHKVMDPEPAQVEINTLTGFVDYVNSEDGFSPDEVLIQVVDQSRVRLVSQIQGVFKQRTTYVVAGTDLYHNPFQYGHFYETESFITALQSLFDETEDREKILRLVGNIKDENVKTVEDDGVTQQVTAKVGIVRSTEVNVPNPVTLKPFRTFREIEQPASKFVFRLKSGQNGSLPTCALFEADGQSWKLEAIGSIEQFLEDRISHITIIA